MHVVVRSRIVHAFAIVLLAGCGKRETPVGAALATQILHVGNSTEPATLDPTTNTMMNEWEILSALFEGLTNVSNDGRTILPGVAERWDISEDGLTYTFHLRRNARWSNGDPLTTADIVYSFQRALDPALSTTGATLIDCIVGARDYLARKRTDFASVGVRAVDPFTLEIRLAYAAPYLLTIVSNATTIFMPVHRPSVEQHGGANRRDGKWTRPGNLVSNGAFVLKAWRANQVVIVTRNAHYWDAARVRLQAVHFHPIEDSAAEERAYRSGQLHTTWGIPENKISVYERTAATELRKDPILQTGYVAFNCRRAPFTDARVRRALALAINRQDAVQAGYRDRSQPARSLVRPGTGGYEPKESQPQDPVAARKLLAEAGFPAGRGFPKVELRLAAGGSALQAVAEAMQQMWKRHLGIEVTLIHMETKVLLASLPSRDFDLALAGYFYSLDDPSDPLARGATGNSGNFAHWSDPRFEAAQAGLQRARNQTERFALFAQLEQILADEMPYLPLYHLDRVYLLHPSVKGWRGNRYALVDWREVWLE